MPENSPPKFLLKDQLFNQEKVEKIASEIHKVYAPFEKDSFSFEVLDKFHQLELKERMYHIRDCLKKYLPSDYIEATTILLEALPPELDPNKHDDDFGDFIYAPYSEYVLTYGCTQAYVAFSLKALREMTKRFSVEFAIRDFINLYPEETVDMLKTCALSGHYHERRLASEGLRPKLPWAKKLTLDYKEAVKPLNVLYYDNTRYVTRSVANHLNDISKIDDTLVINTLKRWQQSKKQEPKEMDFIVKHALRTLVKKGNQDALALLGYSPDPKVDVKINLLTKNVSVGEALVFDVEMKANEDVKLLLDYIIHFQTKSGMLSPKVHKLKQLTLKKGDVISIQKKHHFKENMSTRKFYGGENVLNLQLNGHKTQKVTFFLEVNP
ncbi:MAG: DNA alkylation repair protein [Sulfurovum sp.]|nr:DNA alkylation repair protein [Sulfurovum sp.]